MSHISETLRAVVLTLAFVSGLAVSEKGVLAETSTTTTISSDEIATAIQSDLHDAERLSKTDVDVKVRDGLVTLTGTVRSILDKQLASDIAMRTRGVQAVHNQLLVDALPRPNDELREEIMDRLRINDGIDEPQITLDVTSGRVAVAGKVDSLAEKRIAEFVISSVPGVREVENQLTVQLPTDRSDDELREEISALIVHSVYLDDVRIEVDVRDGVAHLNGTVTTAAQRDDLRRVAEVLGITEVNLDGVEIDSEASDATERKRRYADVTDQSIASALQRVFRADPILLAHLDSIETEVNSGTVELNGTVGRLPIKQRAERLVMDVIGVQRVRNELRVEYPEETPGDMEIIDDTQHALKRSAYLDRQNIRVHCQRAHVSLYGVVDSHRKKQIAGWIAESVPGVVHVNNQLAVERPWISKSDDEIESDLRRKLKFAMFNDGNQVNVAVEDGVAILRGEVDTWRQWQAALDLALEAGAKSPHNMIRVRFHPPHGASRVYVPQ